LKKDNSYNNGNSKNDPLNNLVPLLMEYSKENYSVAIQSKTLTCVNLCLFNMPEILKTNI
jgi:hypothetical protein